MVEVVVQPRATLAGLDLERVAARHLSPNELGLWRELSTEGRRQEWLAGRLAAKLAIRRSLAHPLAAWPLADIEVLRDGQGSPIACLGGFGGPSVSISHTDRFAVAAVSPLGHVGVDIEQIRSRDADFVCHLLTEQEQLLAPSFMGGGRRAVTALWAIKEACLKALGGSSGWPLISVEVRNDPELRVVIDPDCDAESRVVQFWAARWDDHMMAVVVIVRAPALLPAAVG